MVENFALNIDGKQPPLYQFQENEERYPIIKRKLKRFFLEKMGCQSGATNHHFSPSKIHLAALRNCGWKIQ